MARAKAPRIISRGAVVQIREGRNGVLNKQRRGIVMGKTPSSNYTRAYGAEVYVCEISGDAVRASRVASKALRSGKKKTAKAIVQKHTDVSEKSVTMVVPVGRVKKIPKICQLAMKVEKGKL